MTILVTGASGFIGRRVVQALVLKEYNVRALLHTPDRRSLLPDGVEIAYGDVLDVDSLVDACVGVSVVVHLAAVIRESGRFTFQHVNYEGTRNLLRAAVICGIGRFVYASTMGANSDAAIPYLYSRWMAEQEVSLSDVPSVVLRFSAGFGEGDGFFNLLAAQVKLFPMVPIVGDGQVRFQPIAADDMAMCLGYACVMDHLDGKTLDLGGPEYYTYDQIVDLVAETLGVRISKVHVPVWLAGVGVAVMETFMPRSPVTREEIRVLRLDSTTELGSVEKNFGFVPRPLQCGIGYIRNIGLGDALRINLGFMPWQIRDH